MLNCGSPWNASVSPPLPDEDAWIRDAVIVCASNVYGIAVPSLLTTKNFVEVVFQPLRCAFDGTRYDRFTRPGLVAPSVTRIMREPNVGSSTWQPAGPSCGSAGLVRVSRSVIAEY